MRRAVGCLLLLMSVATVFVTIASTLLARTVDASANVNLPLIVGVLALAFIAYCVGMSLLTSIQSDGQTRSRWLPFRRGEPR